MVDAVNTPKAPQGSRLRLEIIRAVPQDWDETLERLGGSIFQTSAWGEYRSFGSAAEPIFCQWYTADDRHPVALALGFLRPGRQRIARRVASWVEFDTPPTTALQGVDLLAPLVDWIKEQRSIVELRLGSFEPLGAWRSDVLPEAAHRIEFQLAPAPRDELVSGMRRLARRSIHKAENLGLTVERGDIDDVAAFAELYKQTLARLHQSKGVPRGTIGIDAITSLMNSGAASLYVTRENQEIIVGWLFGTFGDSAYSLLSGSGDRALETGAVPFTLAYALSDLSRHDYKRLNLGGVDASASEPDSPDHGLYAFKAGLGATPVVCTSGRVVFRCLRSRAIYLARRLLSSIKRLNR